MQLPSATTFSQPLDASSPLRIRLLRAAQIVDRYRRAYFWTFVITLLICWSPSKALAYLAPWLALVSIIWWTRSKITLRRLLLVLGMWFIFTLVHIPFVGGFALHSAFLFLLTYSAFLFAIAVPSRPLGNMSLITRMEGIARWVVLIEGTWGIAQAFYGFLSTRSFDMANGDYVEGTIHPALTAEFAFSNPMFAVNMSLLLLFLMPSLLAKRTKRVVYGIGVISLILASVVHVLLFLGIAMMVGAILYTPRLFLQKRAWLLLAGGSLAAIASFFILQANFGTLGAFVKATVNNQTPRSQVIVRVWQQMPAEYPWMPVLGLGPGQFGSRAGLIGTGMFFGGPAAPKPLPLLPKGMSDAFQKYVLDLWVYVSFNNVGNNTSATYKPYFSWLSVYTELGAPVLIAIFGYVAGILLHLRRRSLHFDDRLMALAWGAGIIFILLLGMQENYWETPQAIFTGLMTLKVQHAYLTSLS